MGRGSWISPYENMGPISYTPGAKKYLDSFRERLKDGEQLGNIIAEEIGADRVYELVVDPYVLSGLAIRRDLIDTIRAARAQQSEAIEGNVNLLVQVHSKGAKYGHVQPKTNSK